jgi:hypothetical protein
MADVCITEYTDPGCPWAYSAEPFRRRLNWLYGDRLEWRVRLVGLAESPDEYGEDQKCGPTAPSQAMSVRPSRAKTVLYIRGDTTGGVPGWAFATPRRFTCGSGACM